MIRYPLASLVLAAAMLAAPALARDARLVVRRYNPDEVVRIEGKASVQASIAFAEDEHIENVAVGDSASWQITPNKRANLLFVKPLGVRARTNMTVVTDRRTYYFDLVASPDANPVYVLRFTYPGDTRPTTAGRTAGTAASGLNAAEAEALAGERPIDPASLNFAWSMKGKARLLPSRIYDDGASTYVTWAAGTPIPAILVKNEKGDEGPVNFAVRDDVIVIDGVPSRIVLRAGRDSALLENRGGARPQPAAASPGAPASGAQALAATIVPLQTPAQSRGQ